MLARNNHEAIRVIYVFLLSLIIFTIFCSNAGAQALSGDFRNTTFSIGKGMDGDVPLFVQTDKMGNQLMIGGVTVVEGDKVSFDHRPWLISDTAGFWKPKGENIYEVIFRNEKGEVYAGIRIRGLVRWDRTKNVIQGAGNFLLLATRNDTKKYMKITAHSFVDGRLVLTTEDGMKYVVFNLSPNPSGEIAAFENNSM